MESTTVEQDKFYITRTSEIVWMQHSDQKVTTYFSTRILREAIEASKTDNGIDYDNVFDYIINGKCRQYLSDAGAIDNRTAKGVFYGKPVAVGRTKETIDALFRYFDYPIATERSGND